MRLRTICLILILVLSGAVEGCAKSQVQAENSPVGSEEHSAAFDYNRHIGWIHGRCLAIKYSDLSPGTVVQIVTLGPPQRALKTNVTGAATPDSGCFALLPDRVKINQKKGRSFYMLDLQEGTEFMAVGLLDYEGDLLPVNDMVRIDLNHDGKRETAHFCQTIEGFKFFLAPVDGSDTTPVWTDYYYLGYDLKPTCKD